MDLSREDSVEEFGEFKKSGKQFYLQQAPYLSDDCSYDPVYTSWAIDSDGKNCWIYWQTICDEDGEMIDTGDESNACDWSVFKVKY